MHKGHRTICMLGWDRDRKSARVVYDDERRGPTLSRRLRVAKTSHGWFVVTQR